MFYVIFKLLNFCKLETAFQVFRKGTVRLYCILQKKKRKTLSAHGCLPLSILSCEIFLQNIFPLNSKYKFTSIFSIHVLEKYLLQDLCQYSTVDYPISVDYSISNIVYRRLCFCAE